METKQEQQSAAVRVPERRSVTRAVRGQESYDIHLDAFDGPMDLLLHLIAKNKIDIYDIPIALLTRQYLDYLDAMRHFNIEVASSFAVMAATLLSIKSRMMLPKPPLTQEGEEEEDPRKELVLRLLAYRKYQSASRMLAELQETRGRSIAKPPMALPSHHVLTGGLSLRKLLAAYGMAVRVGTELKVPDALVTPDPVRVEDRMKDIRARLAHQPRLRFDETFRAGDAISLVTSFLAILELLRLGAITVWQAGTYRDLLIERKIGKEEVESGDGSDGEHGRNGTDEIDGNG